MASFSSFQLSAVPKLAWEALWVMCCSAQKLHFHAEPTSSSSPHTVLFFLSLSLVGLPPFPRLKTGCGGRGKVHTRPSKNPNASCCTS